MLVLACSSHHGDHGGFLGTGGYPKYRWRLREGSMVAHVPHHSHPARPAELTPAPDLSKAPPPPAKAEAAAATGRGSSEGGWGSWTIATWDIPKVREKSPEILTGQDFRRFLVRILNRNLVDTLMGIGWDSMAQWIEFVDSW